MRIARLALPLVVAAALPLSAANAYIPCSPFPLSWPFCIADSMVDTVGTAVAAAWPAPPAYYMGQPINFPPPYTGPAFPPPYSGPPPLIR